MELLKALLTDQEVLAVHANAALTPKAGLKLAELIVVHGWPVARAAERFQVSWPTAKRWADRYRQLGPDGMTNRSSWPHRRPTAMRPPGVSGDSFS